MMSMRKTRMIITFMLIWFDTSISFEVHRPLIQLPDWHSESASHMSKSAFMPCSQMLMLPVQYPKEQQGSSGPQSLFDEHVFTHLMMGEHTLE